MRLRAIDTGTRLGSYEVTSPLGAGGMGEVYRARDTRLGRDVAVKVLASQFAGDPGRRERFEAEARSVAALNHPNILALYDVGTHGDTTFMVTELVEGESLRDARLSPRKALEVAAQVADGLGAAHSAGVTHRDLKPENVMLTRDGHAKILDFGIAKLAETADSAPTRLQTEAGMVVGTVGYMAPEQVRGGPVDARTDIFAFGAMLYELLAGRRAFDAETPAEIMTAVLRHEPPELPSHISPAVRQLVHRCLEKNPEERFQTARDLAFALRHFTGSSIAVESLAADRERRRPGYVWVTAAALAAGAALAGAAVLQWATRRDDGLDPVKLTRIAADRLSETEPSFSPDGRAVAYVRSGSGGSELLVKAIDSLTATTLVRSQQSIESPRWTPDGNRVCYTVRGDFSCVGAAGGTPQRLLRRIFRPQFAPDGRSVFSVRPGKDNQPWLFRSPLDGGESQPIGDASLPLDLEGLSPVSPDGSRLIAFGQSFRWSVPLTGEPHRALRVETGVRTSAMSWLPDSRHIAVVEETMNPAGSRVMIVDTESSARRLVVRSVDPIYAVTVSQDGSRLVYSGGRVERDIAEYSADGRFVRTVAGSANLEGFASWTPDGTRFVYRVGGPGQSDSLWVGSADETPPTPLLQLDTNVASAHRVSPDGGRLVYADPSGISILSTTGGRAIRIVSSLGLTPRVCWSADGEWIWYEGGPVTLRKVPSQGGPSVQVSVPPGQLWDCSPDGRWLARMTAKGLMLTATDGAPGPVIPGSGEFIIDLEASNLFGQGGKVLYLLGRERRSISTVDVDTGRTVRSVTFDLPAEDTIIGFSVDPSGTRVLLTTGGTRYDLWMAEGFARPARWWGRWFGHWEDVTSRGG